MLPGEQAGFPNRKDTMKVKNHRDGYPGGCVRPDALMRDLTGSVWVNREAEVYEGEPTDTYPIHIRRNLDLHAGEGTVFVVPSEDIEAAAVLAAELHDQDGWARITQWERHPL